MKIKDIRTIQAFTIHSQADIRDILSKLPADAEVISITPKESSMNSDNEIFVHSFDVWVLIRKSKEKEEDILP